MKENNKKEYKNWYKTLLRIQKKELILFGVLILLAFIFVGISSDICKWLKTEVIYDIVNNKCLKTEVIHDIVNNKLLINIPICIIISGFAIWWWTKIWKDKDIRPYRLGLIISLFIITHYSKVKYANITENISYEHFFIGLLAISAIIIIIRLWLSPYFNRESLSEWYLSENRFKRLKQIINDIIYKQDNKSELKGFSVDNTEIKLEDNQIKYAKTLVKKLKNTDLSKESFAVGITGEWGTGKSTFLNTMKKEMGEDFAEIVEFNPWLCNSPEQVTQDFFATLINELLPKHSTLSRDLNKYAKLLNKIAKASLSFFGIDLDLTPSDDSLNKLKDKISNKLANLPKKVVILIDDTDRLEGNEVFEILRLIRNTADFKNVIYIATYDKEYVTDVLKENKIKDPDNYLEKIFQVEVHLPKVEKTKLWKTFHNDICNQFNIKEQAIANTILRQLYNDAKLILQTSKNYRQIKRLARRYMVFIDYAKNNLGNEINEINLFWLEILQEQDPKIYDILANDPKKLLSKKNNLYVYEETNTNNKNEIIIKNIITIQILKKLFPSNPDLYIKNTINHNQNYSIYFTLKIPSYKLKTTDFYKLIKYNVDNNLNDDDRITHAKETITEWVNSKKRIDSIVFQFNYYSSTISNENLLKNYLYGLFLISLKAVEYQKNFPVKCYIENFYDEKIKDRTKEIIKYIINYTIENSNNETIVHLSKLLNNIYKTEYYDDQNVNIESYSMIISNKDIEDFLKQLVKKYFKTNNTDNATNVVDKESTLYKLLRNCCIIEKDYSKYSSNELCLYKQLAINEVINHFKNKENKPSIEELNKTLSNNFTKITEFEDFCDEEAYTMDYENDVSDFIIELFGGEDFLFNNYYNSHFDNNEEFQTFKQECFIQNKQTLNK